MLQKKLELKRVGHIASLLALNSWVINSQMNELFARSETLAIKKDLKGPNHECGHGVLVECYLLPLYRHNLPVGFPDAMKSVFIALLQLFAAP